VKNSTLALSLLVLGTAVSISFTCLQHFPLALGK
jgi:hypothetical protein